MTINQPNSSNITHVSETVAPIEKYDEDLSDFESFNNIPAEKFRRNITQEQQITETDCFSTNFDNIETHLTESTFSTVPDPAYLPEILCSSSTTKLSSSAKKLLNESLPQGTINSNLTSLRSFSKFVCQVEQAENIGDDYEMENLPVLKINDDILLRARKYVFF